MERVARSTLAPSGMFLKVNLDCGVPLVACVTREAFAELGLGRRSEVFASFEATAVHVAGRRGAGEISASGD